MKNWLVFNINFDAKLIKLLAVICTLAFAGGCRSPSVVVNREAEVLDAAWLRRAEEFSGRPGRKLLWNEAVRLLDERNPVLLRANEDRFRAERGIFQVYKNLLPYMQLRAGIDKRINELNSIGFDDIRWDFNAYAALSGVLTLSRDVYAAELTYIRAQIVRELTFREKVVDLHRLFINSSQLTVAKQRLKESERILRDMPATQRSLEAGPQTIAFLSEKIRSQQASLDEELLKLFDLVDAKIELAPQGWPEVDYAQVPLNAADSSRVGVLRRKLLAIELVGAQARVKGAKLQYWPDISVFLTSGPLWSTRDGSAIWWRSEELRFSVGAYIPIDITGRVRNQVRDAGVDLEFLKREIALREAIMVLAFEDKRLALIQADRDIKDQERKRSLLMQLISIEGAVNLSERLSQWAEIESRRENAAEQRAQLNAFFLFFDEAFWSGPSSPASLLAAAPIKSVSNRP
jgi:hypothetical protein